MKIEVDNNQIGRLKRVMPEFFRHKNNVEQLIVIEEIVDELLTDYCLIAETELFIEEPISGESEDQANENGRT